MSSIEKVRRDIIAAILEVHPSTVSRRCGLRFSRTSENIDITKVAAAFRVSESWLRRAAFGLDYAVSPRTLLRDYKDTLASILACHGAVEPVASFGREKRFSVKLLGLLPEKKKLGGQLQVRPPSMLPKTIGTTRLGEL